MTVAAEVEQDGLALALFLAALGFPEGAGDRVVCFRSRNDALGLGKGESGGEGFELGDGRGFHLAGVQHVADQRAHAVVAESAGVESGGDKGAAQGVHFYQRGEVPGVAEVVGEFAFGQARAGRGFHAYGADVALATQFLADVGEGHAGEVGSAAGATHDHIRGVVGHGQLLHAFLADDGLVQEHVVEHAAQRILGVFALYGQFHGLGDRDAEGAGAIRIVGEDGTADFRCVTGAGGHLCPKGFHHRAAIGLLIVADFHHVDFALEVEERAGKAEGGAPLAGAGLGGEALYPFLLVVIGLRDGGVRLVGAGRADAFVFVVDARGGIEGLLQAAGAKEGGGSPLAVDVAHFVWDVDVALGTDFLHDQGHGEERREIIRPDGLSGSGMKGGGQRNLQVGLDVVPGGGDLCFIQQVFDGVAHV